MGESWLVVCNVGVELRNEDGGPYIIIWLGVRVLQPGTAVLQPGTAAPRIIFYRECEK